MSITLTLEATRLKCESCDFLYTDDEPDEVRGRLEPAYECGGCGSTFTKDNSNNGANQCPDCYKMAAKMDPDESAECENCNEVSTFEEVPVITCVCHDEEHEVYN